MLPIQGNEIPSKDHVVAHEDGEPRAELDGHLPVVRGTNAHCGSAVRSVLIGQLQDSEEC